MKFTRTAILLGVALSIAPAFAQDGLKRVLPRVYAKWRRAILDRDYAAFKEHTATFRHNATHNLIVSQMQPWPDALFEIPMEPPDVSGLRLLSAKFKSGTANLIYYGKVDFKIKDQGTREIPNNLLVLQFVEEDGKWRYDTTRYIHAGSDPQLHSLYLSKGDFSFVRLPRFDPPGKVPPAPKLCPKPDCVGQLRVVSLGYRCRIRVNDSYVTEVADNVGNKLIIGGLKKEGNKVEIEINPTLYTKKPNLQIKITAFLPSVGGVPTAVFDYRPKNPPRVYENVFPAHVAKGE